MAINFQSILSGPNAFYNQPDYVESTRRDFAQKEHLPSSYTTDTESKVYRIAMQILSYIIFPIAIYNFIHSLIGYAILPSAFLTLLDFYTNGEKNSDCNLQIGDSLLQTRERVQLDSNWKYKRITVEVDGYFVDAYLIGKVDTLANGRWGIHSNGNGEFAENTLLYDTTFIRVLISTNSNGIVFNYPSVGASSGMMPSRSSMEKAHNAMLRLLEDREQGIGATNIFAFGHSLGGGVQGDGILSHPLKTDEANYAFVKSRTYGELSDEVSYLTESPLLGFLSKVFGWNHDTTTSSQKLAAPEIILQTADVDQPTVLETSDLIVDDDVIGVEPSLGKALLDQGIDIDRKVIIGIPERHNQQIRDTGYIGYEIERAWRS